MYGKAYIDLKWHSASILLCTDAVALAQLTQFAEGGLQQGWPLSGGHDITHPSSRTVVFSVTSSVLLTAQQSSKCDTTKLKKKTNKKKTIYMIFQHGNEIGITLSPLWQML